MKVEVTQPVAFRQRLEACERAVAELLRDERRGKPEAHPVVGGGQLRGSLDGVELGVQPPEGLRYAGQKPGLVAKREEHVLTIEALHHDARPPVEIDALVEKRHGRPGPPGGSKHGALTLDLLDLVGPMS
jgi:hypothetical protein